MLSLCEITVQLLEFLARPANAVLVEEVHWVDPGAQSWKGPAGSHFLCVWLGDTWYLPKATHLFGVGQGF